ncbi:integrase arm-type DNA-binding domain-containing protein [Sphingobium yanoikuyae]|uniref:tyrosine-type recombinase/integrase n=1 Tax=Sphingobium yanoikuyae TaxID=13690 RepID=UPI000847AD14|nr:site-specific integrase [Sphingobium yanoikuyae]MDG2516114.1 integrase arm-type DNA-binding domain-containing protein [Sphingobium yanoikuyae]
MAAKKAFTDRWVEAVKATDKRQEISDPGCRGLYLIVQPAPGGKKSWAWRGKAKGASAVQKKTLGSYPAHSLAEARDWADKLTAAREAGIDLDAVRREEEAKAAAAAAAASDRASRTLDWFWTIYEPRFIDVLDDAANSRGMWRNDIQPALGGLVMADIRHEDVERMVEKVRQRAPVRANRVLSMTKTIFKRALSYYRSQTLMTTNPAEYVMAPTKEVSRDRVLRRDEFGIVLRVIDEMIDSQEFYGPYARSLRLIVATGVRRDEAAEAPWHEFDLDGGSWLIPGERTKNGLPLLLDLTPNMLEYLSGLKAPNRSEYVFNSVSKPTVPMSGFSKAKDVVFGRTVEIATAEGVRLENWTAHDLRRTVATMMNDLADEDGNPLIQPAIVEATLNHISGVKSDVAGVYNRAAYRAQKKRALLVWEAELDAIRQESVQRAEAIKQAA